MLTADCTRQHQADAQKKKIKQKLNETCSFFLKQTRESVWFYWARCVRKCTVLGCVSKATETEQEAQQDGQICQLMLNMSNLIYNNKRRSLCGNDGEMTQGDNIFGSILKPDKVS